VFYSTLDLKTTLTANQIQESFATPETISFWDLPRFIGLAEAAGFFRRPNTRLHYTLACCTHAVMRLIFVAAGVSLRLAR